MLAFVGKVFRTWFEGILWVCLIGSVIIGGVVGHSVGYRDNYTFLGIIVGGIFGFLFVILGGGLVANFLSMVDNIDKLVNKDGNTVPGNSEPINDADGGQTPREKINDGPIDTSKTIRCTKCKEEYYFGAVTKCPNCGNEEFEDGNTVAGNSEPNTDTGGG